MDKQKKEQKEFKTCKKCRKKKHATEYYSRGSNCKTCHKKTVIKNQKQKKEHYNSYRIEYAKQHPEKVNIWKKHFIKNWEKRNGTTYKDHVLAAQNLRRASDLYKNKARASAKLYRAANRDKLLAKSKEYYLKNRDVLNKNALEKYHANREQYNLNCKIYRSKKYLKKLIPLNNSEKIKLLIVRLTDLYKQLDVIKAKSI